ncbi:MAG: SspB family protein [Hyphomonadaceae bacterium]
MAEDLIGYDQLTQDAMREVVRAALNRATGPRGLPGRHHFYITFRTKAPGVILPDQLLGRYPDEMTIVLEHQFWDLEVYADKFRVILKFAGQPHPIVIPFNAVSRFYDPSVRFGLQFDQAVDGAAAAPAVVTDENSPPAATPEGQNANGAVVSLDAFRKK